jgi:hypothetical protein
MDILKGIFCIDILIEKQGPAMRLREGGGAAPDAGGFQPGEPAAFDLSGGITG